MFLNFLKFLFAGLITASGCFAQNINISGTVINNTGVPLPGAFVWLEKAGLVDTTDNNGKYKLTIVSIKDKINQPSANMLSARIHNRLLYLNTTEKSAVEIIILNLKGRTVTTMQKTVAGGICVIPLPTMGAGVYWFVIKSAGSELLIKSYSLGNATGGTTRSLQAGSPDVLSKDKCNRAFMYDYIAVKKDGYLNYRAIVTNDDTSGMDIRLIVCEEIVSDIDGNTYQTVRIGNQIWTVDNLRTTKYNDGTAIPQITDSAAWVNDTSAKYCYYNNATDDYTVKIYGALYNWYAIDTKKLAPVGWHIPSIVEWDTLNNYLINNGYNWDGTTTGNKIAKSVAAKVDWLTTEIPGSIGKDLDNNNRSGFAALPSGHRESDGNFYFRGAACFWWSTTASSASGAFHESLQRGGAEMSSTNGYLKICGFSVRLLKD